MATQLTQAQRDAAAKAGVTINDDVLVYYSNVGEIVGLQDSPNEMGTETPIVSVGVVVGRRRKRGGGIIITLIDSDGDAYKIPAHEAHQNEADAWAHCAYLVEHLKEHGEEIVDAADLLLTQIEDERARLKQAVQA